MLFGIVIVIFCIIRLAYGLGQHGGAVASTVASEQEGSGVLEFACSPCVSGYSGFFPQSEDMHIRLIR